MIEAVGPEAVKEANVRALVYPVIQYGTEVEGEGGVYLTEDGEGGDY